MARYQYTASLVQESVEILNSAAKAITNTNTEMLKGISQIQNARASQNLDIQADAVTGYQSLVTDLIDQMSTTITTKAQEIEEYNAQPVWKKVFATIGVGALKLVEGLGTFVENIGDGLVSIVGFTGGLFNSDFKNACAEFVMKDHVGDAFAKGYEAESGPLAWLNDNSYMSHQSTAANIFKGVGVAAGYVVLSIATAGAGTAVSLGISAAASFAGGVGAGTQSGLKQAQAQALAEGIEFNAGESFNAAFGKGVKQGAIAAGTTLLVGGVANKLTAGTRATAAVNSMDELSTATNGTRNALNTFKTIASGSDEMATLADDVANLVNSADEVAALADDAVTLGGTTIKNANSTFKMAKDVAKQAQALKTAAQAAGVSDEVLNSLDDVISQAGKAADVAKVTKSAIAAAQGTSVVTSEGNRLTNAIANSGVAKGINNATTALANSKVGQVATHLGQSFAQSGLGQGIANASTKLGAVGTNAVVTGLGQTTSGGITTPIKDAGLQAEIQNMSEPVKYDIKFDPAPDPLPNPPSDPGPINRGVEPQDTSNPPVDPTPDPTPGSGGGGGYTPPTSAPITSAPTTSAPITTPPTIPTTPITSPISTQPITTPVTTPGPKIDPTITDENPYTGLPTEDVVNSEVDLLDSSVGSLAGLTESSINIPHSSEPIISEGLKTKSSSVIPAIAGISAAGIAGIGAKAYLDKRESSEDEEEENDELTTEEWQEDPESMAIDYGDSQEEADYLMPTDEFAFQEN